MKPFPFLRLLCGLALVALGATALPAQNLDAIKARMEQRLEAVNALKDRGVAGENNRGYLEIRGGGSGPEQQVISEENADRRTVYIALAEQTGSTPEVVGRHRAQQLADLARRGHWIQAPNGQWRQKG